MQGTWDNVEYTKPLDFVNDVIPQDTSLNTNLQCYALTAPTKPPTTVTTAKTTVTTTKAPEKCVYDEVSFYGNGKSQLSLLLI